MKRDKWVLVSVLAASLLAFTPHFVGQDLRVQPLHFMEPYHQARFPLQQGGFKHWRNGYLITHAWNRTLQMSPNRPGVILYDRDGRVAREPVVWIEGAREVSVNDVSVSKVGTVVVSGVTVSQQGGLANFIAEVGSDDRVDKVIRTAQFLPAYVCALEDGTVWAYGVDRDDRLKSIDSSLRLRHYSFEKGLLHAMLDGSGLNTEWPLLRGRYPGEISLSCNSKTVVLYNGRTGEMIEVDVKTDALKITNVPPLPESAFNVTGFTLTDSGEILASFLDGSTRPALSGLFKLNRDNSGSAKWNPVEGMMGPYLQGSRIERLMGSDGDDIVYTSQKDDKMFWSKPAN